MIIHVPCDVCVHQVIVASTCELFPERTDLESLIGVGVSPSCAARSMSVIEGRIDDFMHVGTAFDTIQGIENESEGSPRKAPRR